MATALKTTVLASLLLLGACRSEPISFHTLLPAQPASARSSAGDILIESLSVPAQVDRQQIVIREGNSALAVLETEWWAASLADELRSALVDQLSNTRPSGRKLSLRVDVQRFDSVPGQYALLDATWRLRGADSRALPTCRSTLQTPAGASIDALVGAQQANVKRLAEAIATAAADPRLACPAGR